METGKVTVTGHYALLMMVTGFHALLLSLTGLTVILTAVISTKS